jgi:NAD-dependent SIR2 family protein deacetylase
MWLGGVEVPDTLVEARLAGRLVIFAGAGVSVARPSGIPTFADMVATVQEESGQPRRKSEPLDASLGRVNASGYRVHERVERIIRSAGSENALHRAIVGLFDEPAHVRVVTTNFDRLLTRAAEGRWPGVVQEYVAPPFPWERTQG